MENRCRREDRLKMCIDGPCGALEIHRGVVSRDVPKKNETMLGVAEGTELSRADLQMLAALGRVVDQAKVVRLQELPDVMLKFD
jgi:hypothetical protein